MKLIWKVEFGHMEQIFNKYKPFIFLKSENKGVYSSFVSYVFFDKKEVRVMFNTVGTMLCEVNVVELE